MSVSQGTFADLAGRRLRNEYSSAAAPEDAEALYDYMVERCAQQHNGVSASGQFGADLQVSLLNDGPVTFLLES